MRTEIMYQNLWDTAETALRGKLTTPKTHIRKLKRLIINSLTSQLKELEK